MVRVSSGEGRPLLQPALRQAISPAGGRYYGCRQCYELTYASAQEHDPRVSRLANDPMALYAVMREALDDAGDDTLMSASRLILALKAHDQVERRERGRS